MTILVLSGLVWGHGYSQYKRDKIPKPGKQWLEGVSILLLKDFNQADSNTHRIDITSMIQDQGLSLENPFLIQDLREIGSLVQTGFTVFYPCNFSAKYVPDECGNTLGTRIVYRFRYMLNPPSTSTPLGDVSYKYGILYPNYDCVPAKGRMQNNWGLYYLKVMFRTKQNKTVGIEVNKPWESACTIVHPVFDSSIDIC